MRLSSCHFPPPQTAGGQASQARQLASPAAAEAAQAERAAADTRYAIPLQDLFELTYLTTGWFNVLGSGGETIVHVEVVVRPHGRVLEVKKVYCKPGEPGHSELLACVGPPGTASTPRPTGGSRQEGSLPGEVLEVCLQAGKLHATIESCGSGSYAIVKDGRQAFKITGDSVELELSVLSAMSGRPAARIERKGVTVDDAEFLELVIAAGWPSASMFILASVLAIIILRAWPVKEVAPEGAQFPRLASVVGASPPPTLPAPRS